MKKNKNRSKEVKLTTIGMMKGMPTYERPKKLKGWLQFRSYREGMEAGKHGEPRTSCPYPLPEEVQKLLLKRDRWIRGWEEASFALKNKAYHKRIDREKAEQEEKERKQQKRLKKKKKHRE